MFGWFSRLQPAKIGKKHQTRHMNNVKYAIFCKIEDFWALSLPGGQDRRRLGNAKIKFCISLGFHYLCTQTF